MLKRVLGLIAATAITTAATVAPAATYNVTSHLEGEPMSIEHSLWFSTGPTGATGTKANHFLFENSASGFGTFVEDAGTATLTGTALNADGQGFLVSFAMSLIAAPAYIVNSYGVDTSDWRYYGLTAATLTSQTVGINSFDVSLVGWNGGTAVQVGTGAANKNQGVLGIGAWFDFTEQNCNAECEVRYGDINANISAVPLPSSIALLPIGLGLLGFGRLRSRQKS